MKVLAAPAAESDLRLEALFATCSLNILAKSLECRSLNLQQPQVLRCLFSKQSFKETD
jgi:hypothetical protein